ncbi:MAG: integration host factor subunit beta [Zoogloeaceae bacterium]|jgi:integration host factor subunit beta|nr:integration host factor subunit beta [Zoogloeaceae bacterium]
MTRSELTERLVKRFRPLLEGPDVEEAVKALFAALAEALVAGHRIEVRGFGSFSLNHRPGRVGRNPKTGEAVEIPEKWAPHFKPGKELRERIDKGRLRSA